MGKGDRFLDSEFPATYESIDQIEHNGNLYDGRDVGKVVEWRRLKDLAAFARMTDGKACVRLFEDGVRSSDITQGALGDCWLLSSLACLTSRAGAVEKLFMTPQYNDEGRYQIRLWDRHSRTFRDTVVDDSVPVWKQNGQPCFARPVGNEAWVMLLEKAMAKLAGSYWALQSGMCAWALEALTGHYTCAFLLDGKFGNNRQAGGSPSDWKWMRAELVSGKQAVIQPVVAFGGKKPSAVSRSSMYTYDQKDETKFYTHEEVYMAIVYHLAVGNLVAAATGGDDDDTDVQGVVRAHAYTVIAAQPVTSNGRGELMMMQVRNPHGSGGMEWSGDWSDRSTLWAKHPEVAQALGYTPPASVTAGHGTTDGFFWMEWRDFCQHFKEVTFCCTNGFDYVEDPHSAEGWLEVFNDAHFPADFRSLGDYKFIYNGNPTTGQALEDIIKWLRLKEIAAPDQFRRGARGLKLFAGGVHPDDIDGSNSGLMVAVACLANKPGAVEQLFLTKAYAPDGSYQVRLYEPKTGLASIKPFDDRIPCFNGNPITKTKILGSEVWVLLLEKAVARMVNSYSKVSMWGVQVCWALACLTGEYTCLLMWEDTKRKWRRLELEYLEQQPAQYRASYASDEQSLYDNDQVFKLLQAQLLLGCLAAAETDRQTDVSATTGLARGRSYSLLDAREVVLRPGVAPVTGPSGGATGENANVVKLLKLRDPGRQNEWKGDWSDGSGIWDLYPQVAQALDFRREAGGAAGSSGRADGSFWITWDDFWKYFRGGITLCGNSLKGNQRPWEAPPAEVERAARRLAEARRQQKLQDEQEALEDSLAAELRQRAVDRTVRGPASGAVFAQAALSAAAAAPKRDEPPPPPPPTAAAGAGAVVALAAPAALAPIKGPVPQQGQMGAPGINPENKPLVVVVENKGCRGCAIM